MKLVVVICLVLFAFSISVDAVNSRARVTRRQARERSEVESGESSRSTQATFNRKLGFAFVLDNGNDIETVHETKAAHPVIEENKKQGAREADKKQKARDADYSSVLAKINKENQEFSSKLAAEAEARQQRQEAQKKKEAEESTSQQSESGELSDEESSSEQQQKRAEDAARAAEESSQEARQKGIIKMKPFSPEKGSTLLSSADIKFTGAYTYMFFLKPGEVKPSWTNIFHKGSKNEERSPAVWFIPGQRKLHVRSGTDGNWNNGCDPSDGLAADTWTHVAIVHNAWGIRVYFNGAVKCESNIGAPIPNQGPLYVSDPWHDASTASIADFRVLSKAVTTAEINAAVDAKKGISF